MTNGGFWGFSSLRFLLLCSFLSCIIRTVSAKNDIFVQAQNAVEESPYYSIDGSNNNLDFPSWGQMHTPRIRNLPNASRYFDQIAPSTGGGIPVDEFNFDLPSARRIMEGIFSQATPHKDKGTNHMMLEFGHFIVQDIIGRTLMNDTDLFPMTCDGEVKDIVFCPVTGKTYSIPFNRSQHFISNRNVARASLNGETAFLDMSNLYGNTLEGQKQVRAFQGGRVQLDEMGLPPVLDKYNSSPGVFAMYVVFLRYHNILAKALAEADPTLSDEQLFQEARKKNIAIYQFIAEEKYIPTLLGSKLKPYETYNPNVDPSIDEFFAAASFRYAHSSFSGLVRLLDENFNPTGSDPLILRDVFRPEPPNDVPRVVRSHGGIEPFLRGLTVTTAKAVDASIVHDFNYFTEATSLLDIQRGRDVGLPSYNDAREAFGLPRVTSFEDLVGYDYQEILTPLKELYNNDIEKLDAYVGALLEAKDSSAEMGPLFTLSIKDQFERARDGDRLWYRNQYSDEEWQQFPSLATVIKETCKGNGMENWPSDSFLAWDGVVDDGTGTGTCAGGSSSSLSLLGSKYVLGWSITVPTAADLRAQPDMTSTMEATMTISEQMTGPGFLGVGWRSQVMKGAEIWWCTVDAGVLATETFPAACDPTSTKVNAEKKLFSCCLAQGGLHVQPVCSTADASVYYDLTVVDWCLTPVSSSVTVSAPACDENAQFTGNCFRTSSAADGTMDFIVAYNSNQVHTGHGYRQRTAASANLADGRMLGEESKIADEGLIATHAVFMLCGWMVFAPAAVFIARYMKTRQWRLVAHVSLMGIVGSMMVPLLVGVEASVGATDKTVEHSFVGLLLLGVYFIMVFAGRIRYLKLQGKKVGRKTYFFSAILHKYGGVVMVLLAWWNCYTGLVRIGPEDSYFQVFILSSIPLGYNLDIFGFIQQYIYFPYLGCVVFTFIIAEAQRYRLNSSSHASKLQGILSGKNSIWEDGADEFLDKMTMDAFMEATKLGTMLCIVDGYVLDITSFVENHPGGQHLLRYAAGSDITEEFVGKRDVDGLKHIHSHSAVQLMKTFVKAVLVDDENHKLSFMKAVSSKLALSGRSSNAAGLRRMSLVNPLANARKPRQLASVFRRGRVVGLKYLTPDIKITHTSKPVILVQLALPKTRNDLHVQKLISLPSCAFTFRGIDQNKVAVDRQYTPVKINNDFRSDHKTDQDEEIFDFIISLVPGGKMTKIFLDMRIGKVLLAQGPTINPDTVTKFRTGEWRTVVLIAAGTGVSPMLQVIDYYIGKLSSEFQGLTSTLPTEVPNMYLMWVVKGPKYNYSEALALDARVARSLGKFKYTVIYSTSKGKKEPVVPRQKLLHQWTFKEVMDKTKPKAGLIGFRKPPKVKRQVFDAARKARKLLSQGSRKPLSFGAASTDDDSEDSSDEFSIQNEITEATWTGEEVQTCYRSYNKMLLEELLLSIPKTAADRTSSSVTPFSMPSIMEDVDEEPQEETEWAQDDSSDDESSKSPVARDGAEDQGATVKDDSNKVESKIENGKSSFDDGCSEDNDSKGSYEETIPLNDGSKSLDSRGSYTDEGSVDSRSYDSRSRDSRSYDSRSYDSRSQSYSSVYYLSRITEESWTETIESKGNSANVPGLSDLMTKIAAIDSTESKGNKVEVPDRISWSKKEERPLSTLSMFEKENQGNDGDVPDSILLSEKEETGTVATEPSGSSPESNLQTDLESNYLTSWLPPSGQERSSWMPRTGLDAVKHASYGGDYVSFDHKQLLKGFATTPSGTVIHQNIPPAPRNSNPIPPRLGSPPAEPRNSNPIPPRLGSPPPERTPSAATKGILRKSNQTESEVPFARNISVAQNRPPRQRFPSLEKPSNGPAKVLASEHERPSLEERTPSKTLGGATADSRQGLSRRETRVDELLDQHEINEEEYRERKILVAISGAPMFEYKTRMNLSDLGFPKENMVTFHASAQQL